MSTPSFEIFAQSETQSLDHVQSTAHSRSQAVAAQTEGQALTHVAQSFEAIFVRQMLKQMRASVPSEGLFSESHALKTYQELLDAQLSDHIAQQGRLGIAAALTQQYQPLVRQDEPGLKGALDQLKHLGHAALGSSPLRESRAPQFQSVG